MAGVWRQELNYLQPGTQNAIVIGIIIHSANPRALNSNNLRFPIGNERAVWSFTLRDSPEDFVNVTIWGSKQYINNLFNSFQIGSVVEIINGKVTSRKYDDPNEKFIPSVTCPFNITVNEGSALIQHHDDNESKVTYEYLLKLPTKTVDSLRPLKYVLENIEELRDKFIDLLVVVTFIGEVRDIISRDGREFKCRTFECTDDSTDRVISLVIWDMEWLRLSELWELRKTVLFLSDAVVGYNKYEKKLTVSLARKTVITENPQISMANDLRNSIRDRPEFMSSDPYTLPNPKNITNMMNVKEISQKLNSSASGSEMRVQFFALLYATITEINLDSSNSSLLLIKCALCKRMVKTVTDSCMNLECPCGNGNREPYNNITLNIKLNLKDETGYLIGCRLIGNAAEGVLGLTATQFQLLDAEQRMELKWKFILAQFDIRMQILGPTSNSSHAVYNILHMTPIDIPRDFVSDVVMNSN